MLLATKLLGHFAMAVLASIFTWSVTTGQETTQPNIIVIMADDLGYNDVSYHGSEIWTPNLDQLAVMGVRLENYYTSPQCAPSRAQFLSGRYNIHLGTQHTNFAPCRPSGLPLEYPTLADEMRRLNYSTHMIGKWHLGHHTEHYLPTNRGFDTFRGMLLGGGDHYKHSKRYGNKEAIDFYEGTTPFNNTYGMYSTHVFTRRAENTIKFHGVDRSKPMFMWLSYQAVHTPTQVPEQYESLYNFIPDRNRRRLAGMVAALDEGVGKVVQALKDADLYDNTVIVFSTDNGGQAAAGSSNYPLRGNKNTLFEGGIKGVGFVTGPVLSRSGAVCEELVHITDWMPTLIHLAGGDTEHLAIDGINQWPSINTGSASPREEILLNIDNLELSSHDESQSTIFDTRIQAGIRWQNWKLLTGDPGYHLWVPSPQQDYSLYSSIAEGISNRGVELNETMFLYNLNIDSAERLNLIDLMPHVAMNLLTKLANYQNSSIPAYNPPHSRKCNPGLNGGFWGPYIFPNGSRPVSASGKASRRRQKPINANQPKDTRNRNPANVQTTGSPFMDVESSDQQEKRRNFLNRKNNKLFLHRPEDRE